MAARDEQIGERAGHDQAMRLPTTRPGASPNSCPGTGNRSTPPALLP